MTLKNLEGERYGRLVIEQVLPRITHNRRVLVKCDCGNKTEVLLGSLRNGRTTSCGCYAKERSTTHGLSRTPSSFYRTWANIKSRCSDPANPRYGGRGINMCDEWANSFEAFNEWATRTYIKGFTIDRIDNSKGYCPENCRWADKTTQSRNRRAAKNSTSKYIGVYKHSVNDSWIAQITVDKEVKIIGSFASETAAAQARDQYIIDNNLSNFSLNNA